MSDDLDDLLREIRFEPPEHLEPPPWPEDAAASLHTLPPPPRPRRWPLAAAGAVLLAASALLVVDLPQPLPPTTAADTAGDSWPAVAQDDQLRWLSDPDAIEGMEWQMALHAAPMCPPPGAASADPYCMGLR